MGLFHETLYDALDVLLRSLPPPGSSSKEGETEEEMYRELEEGYKKARKILEDHLKTEFSDERSVGRLIVLFKLYREKIEQARAALDKDFSLIQEMYGRGKLSREQLKEKVHSIPNVFHDTASFERLIQEAEKHLKEIESILAQLIKDEKIKLK